MKKVLGLILAIAMIVACVCSFAACSGKETLQVYTNAGFAPFEYVNDQGEVVGVDIDVMNYIGKELGYKVIINDIDFDNILNEVSKNPLAVGAAGMSKKASRDEVALASKVYATSVQYVIAPNGAFAADAVVTTEQILAYADKIGVQKGTTGADLIAGAIEDAGNNPDDIITEYANAIVASQDIGTAACKAVIIDELPAKAISGANSNLSCWKIDAEAESYVLYFNKEATELVEKVNALLDKMIADGTIAQYIVNHSSGK